MKFLWKMTLILKIFIMNQMNNNQFQVNVSIQLTKITTKIISYNKTK